MFDHKEKGNYIEGVKQSFVQRGKGYKLDPTL